MESPTLDQAVEWIARNDEPTILEESGMEGLISVLLVADLFESDPGIVARKVIEFRKRRT